MVIKLELSWGGVKNIKLHQRESILRFVQSIKAVQTAEFEFYSP